MIASEDGTELFGFDATGRHLRTLNALTGGLRYEFRYDTPGLLIDIEDADGNVTTIERNADGTPAAIVGPYGQRTTVSLDINQTLK